MLTRRLVVLLCMLLTPIHFWGQDLSPTITFGSPSFFRSQGEFIPQDPKTIPSSLGQRMFQNLNLGQLLPTLKRLEGYWESGEYLAQYTKPNVREVYWVQFNLVSQGQPGAQETTRILGIRKEVLDPRIDRLIRREDFSFLGIWIQTTHFMYTRAGQLQALETFGTDGIRTSQSFSWNQDRLVEERLSRGNRLELRVFDQLGSLSRVERFVDDVLREELTYQYSPTGLVSRVSRLFDERGSESRRQETTFDALGREIIIRDFQGSIEQRVQRLEYLDESQLVIERSIESSTSEVRVIRYQYNQDQELVSELTFMNNVPVQSREFDGTKRIESFYQRGQVVLRITYENEVRVLEEEIQNGRVIRRRVLSQGNLGVMP